MIAAFVLTAFPFLCLIFFLLGIFLVETERFGWTTTSMLLVGILTFWVKPYGIPAWIASNLLLSLSFVAAYLAAGVAWSFVKWYSYLIDYRNKFIDIKNNYLASKEALIKAQQKYFHDNHILENGEPVKSERLPAITGQVAEHFKSGFKEGYHLSEDYRRDQGRYEAFHKPQVSEYKYKIINWMCFWPFSLIGTFINDPVRRLFNYIFHALKQSYQDISDKIFGEFPSTKK